MANAVNKYRRTAYEINCYLHVIHDWPALLANLNSHLAKWFYADSRFSQGKRQTGTQNF